MPESALYPGTVMHQRLRPRAHRLHYRVTPMLIDLDELPSLDRGLRLFAYNKAGVFSFHDSDHGAGAGCLRDWVLAKLSEAAIRDCEGRITLLSYPRMFGYVFNPLSVYFCHRADGHLAAILYEVNNMLGERHTYVIPTDGVAPIRQTAAKQFYVSPFVPMDCVYRFRVRAPDEKVVIAIAESDPEGPLLSAVFEGHRQPLSDWALARMLIAVPLMTLKIVAGIYYEALKLWLKGTPIAPVPRSTKHSLIPATRRGGAD